MISGSTRVFALLGDPVAHSLSPVMQNAAFHALGLPAAYVPLRCRAEDVAPLIRALARAGGGGNVTIPHKEEAARAVDRLCPDAAALAACNTFWAEGEASVGDLTDVAGVLDALAPLEPPDTGWLIAGTGGSARAVVGAARTRGAPVAVLSRDGGRRERFEGWAASRGVRLVPKERCGVLINATPLGLRHDDPLPIPLNLAPAAEVALDLVYARGETAWVRALRFQGLRAADGRAVLVAQGAAAFERWFPGVRAPREIMGAAVDAALR
ncbi:MAG TPA: shikimate dehydrogenase [Gemmatimonadales bacterium]|nr:shikimate dehydrogenase [Gemmatimonadales bacterium]